jgi:hypothetical protein
VLALVVAADDHGLASRSKEVEHRFGLGSAIDEIADADDEVFVADSRPIEQLEELAMARVDVTDDEWLLHGLVSCHAITNEEPMAARGQKSGHPHEGGTEGASLAWPVYIDGLIAEHGSLAAVCERIAAVRGFKEDVESIARALRRLRRRGSLSGGAWGDRLLATFGLPIDVRERLRFMGQYHSRFVDLPLPLATDLVRLWDRPPTSESRAGRLWLSLARATLALRGNDLEDAAAHLSTAAKVSKGDAIAEIEVALGLAVIASHAKPGQVPSELDPVSGWLTDLEGGDADCLRARYIGQVSHALNHAGEIERALDLHLALLDTNHTHPFARSRRANGIAYGLYRKGERDAALSAARKAATYAGDAGHVRLRTMALLMISRIGKASAEAQEARHRARAIARTLADARLIARCDAADRDALDNAPGIAE